MQNQSDFTHFNEKGNAFMVNVGDKPETIRTATAFAKVLVSKETFELIKTGGMKKGDVLTTAQIAGIMAAKQTPHIIPMCHPIFITGVDMDLSLNEKNLSVDIKGTVKCNGKTGVEMESLTCVSVAALTVYDMCKAVQKDIVISDVKLLEKTGGVHGDFKRTELP
jgi:cyclic pyranopterin phosphate synthase